MRSRIAEVLEGMEFPASKRECVDYARNSNASAWVVEILQKLPDRIYYSMAGIWDGLEGAVKGDLPLTRKEERKETMTTISEKAVAELRDVLKSAKMETASFSLNPAAMGSSKEDTEKIKEATRLYRESYIIRPLQSVLAGLQNSREECKAKPLRKYYRLDNLRTGGSVLLESMTLAMALGEACLMVNDDSAPLTLAERLLYLEDRDYAISVVAEPR